MIIFFFTLNAYLSGPLLLLYFELEQSGVVACKIVMLRLWTKTKKEGGGGGGLLPDRVNLSSINPLSFSSSSLHFLRSRATIRAVPSIPPCRQRIISKVLAPSCIDDGKSLRESSKIGVLNQSYSWPK